MSECACDVRVSECEYESVRDVFECDCVSACMSECACDVCECMCLSLQVIYVCECM